MKLSTPTAPGEEMLALHSNKGDRETKKMEHPQRSHIFLSGKIPED